RQLARRDRRHLASSLPHDAEKLVVIPRAPREPRAGAAAGRGTVTRLAHAIEGEPPPNLSATVRDAVAPAASRSAKATSDASTPEPVETRTNCRPARVR